MSYCTLSLSPGAALPRSSIAAWMRSHSARSSMGFCRWVALLLRAVTSKLALGAIN